MKENLKKKKYSMGIRVGDLINHIICSHSIYKIRAGLFRKRRKYFRSDIIGHCEKNVSYEHVSNSE